MRLVQKQQLQLGELAIADWGGPGLLDNQRANLRCTFGDSGPSNSALYVRCELPSIPSGPSSYQQKLPTGMTLTPCPLFHQKMPGLARAIGERSVATGANCSRRLALARAGSSPGQHWKTLPLQASSSFPPICFAWRTSVQCRVRSHMIIEIDPLTDHPLGGASIRQLMQINRFVLQ